MDRLGARGTLSMTLSMTLPLLQATRAARQQGSWVPPGSQIQPDAIARCNCCQLVLNALSHYNQS